MKKRVELLLARKNAEREENQQQPNGFFRNHHNKKGEEVVEKGGRVIRRCNRSPRVSRTVFHISFSSFSSCCWPL
jgi:hypothetical protein